MKKKRIIILGSDGFVASSVREKLEQYNVDVLSFSKKKLNLVLDSSANLLKKVIKKNDYVFFSAARAPVKDIEMLTYNLKMLKIISNGINYNKIKKLIYLSSDAVYKDTKKKITERSTLAPNSFHGIMHYLREIYLKKYYKNKICIIRPTLIYGHRDPHCGYGPNKFIRDLKKNKSIFLYGKGEERRDHIFINDISFFISKLIINNFFGEINLATGQVNSFFSIAKKLKQISKSLKTIKFLKRNSPMPHLGLRVFDNKKLINLFPKYKFKSFFQILSEQYKNY